ncbi:MAG: DUF481 domain-containing protein [Luteibaculaceae bacterium]
MGFRLVFFTANLASLKRIGLVAGLFGMVHFTGFSQIVNIESQRLNSYSEGWAGNIRLNINHIQNRTELTEFRNVSNLRYTWDNKSIMLITNLALLRTNRESVLNEGYQHVRYNVDSKENDRFSWETYEQVQYNRVLNLALRVNVGSGPRYRFLDRDTLRMYAGASVMFEYEKEIPTVEHYDIRMNLYYLVNFNFSERFQLAAIFYYQPKPNDNTDYRLSSEVSFDIVITKRVSFNSGLRLFFDSAPPPDTPDFIYRFENGLVYRF